MIEDKDNRDVERNVFDTRDFDAPKVDPERKPQEGDNDATNHGFLVYLSELCGSLCPLR
jgi:hypothetical protein